MPRGTEAALPNATSWFAASSGDAPDVHVEDRPDAVDRRRDDLHVARRGLEPPTERPAACGPHAQADRLECSPALARRSRTARCDGVGCDRGGHRTARRSNGDGAVPTHCGCARRAHNAAHRSEGPRPRATRSRPSRCRRRRRVGPRDPDCRPTSSASSWDVSARRRERSAARTSLRASPRRGVPPPRTNASRRSRRHRRARRDSAVPVRASPWSDPSYRCVTPRP